MTLDYLPAKVAVDGVTLNDQDPNGATWVLESPDGWHNGPGVEVDQQQRVVAHGQFGQAGHRTGRLVVLNGAVAADSRAAVLQASHRLASILANGGFGDMTFTDSDDVTLHARVQLASRPEIDWLGSLGFRFQLQLLAPDPYRYGVTSSASTGFASEPEGIGFIWDGFPGGVATWQPLGTVYAWTGPEHASASTKTVDGVEVDRNLCTNPGSEVSAAFSSNGGSNTPVQSTAQAKSGTYSTLLNRGAGSSLIVGRRNVAPSLGSRTASNKVKVSFAIFVASSYTGSVGIRMSGAGVSESSASTHVEVPGVGAWYRIETSGTDTGSGDVNVDVAGGTAGVDIWVDEIKVTYGAAGHTHGAYFDGDTPDELGAGNPGSLGIAQVANPGTAPSRPVFTVAGPAPAAGFRISEVGTGSSITFLGVVPSGSSLVIDTASASAVIDGVADRSGDVILSGDWPTVPAGGSREYLFQSLGDNETTALTVDAVATYY